MPTLNPATRLSSPELAVTRAGPPLRVRLPAGGWQVGFRTQHDGRTVIEVTGQDGALGLVLGKDAAQVAFAEDEHPIGDLGPGGEHEPFLCRSEIRFGPVTCGFSGARRPECIR